uniref:Pentatricopeptide repeat-containing protein n=1 Tax=Arundo donax TaxID=35708 RepID=A0A0A9H0R2_ARUDO
MYVQCGDIRKARQVFDAMPVRDSVSWNIMLAGCLRHGLWLHSMGIWRRMLREGHKPDSAVLSIMLSLLSLPSENDSKWGLEIHAWVIRHRLESELSIATALIRMYSKKNELGCALSVFESMPVKDRSSWNAIISAHRKDYGVLMMFRRMVDSGVQPDESTFATMVSACNDLGLVEGGMRLFSEMDKVYRVQPTMEHCTCMVTMLSKAGMVNEAYEFVSKRMSLNSEPKILRALLCACSVHGNTRIGEIVANRLFDLEPENEHNFVLLMQIYQNAGRLEDVENVKKGIEGCNVKLNGSQ